MAKVNNKRFTSSKAKFLLILAIIIVAVLLSTLMIFHILSNKFSLGLMPSSKEWHIYHDPDGYFTIEIPNSWKIERDASDGLASVTIKNQTFNYKQPSITFSDKTGTAQIAVTVFEYGEQMQKQMCEASGNDSTLQNDTTFAGMPASYNDFHDWISWTFSTTNADYQVSYQIKDHLGGKVVGLLYSYNSEPTSIPLPKNVVDGNNQDLQFALKSFKPLPDIAYNCSQ